MDIKADKTDQLFNEAMGGIPYAQRDKKNSRKQKPTEFDNAFQKYSDDMLKKFNKRH